jgi:DNA invertase Pin-like site-specific DNA recombinase
MEKEKKKRWAIYCRVSTADQSSGLDSQCRAMREFCERQGVADYELFTDEGISGAKESRPSLNRMMIAVEDGTISHVAVYSFSRFARSTTHLLKALEKFQKIGVEFISLTEQIQTNSPMGRAFFTVIAAIAQLERELIVERVKNGLKAARARGKHIGRKKMRNSEMIRALRAKGMTYRAIAELCNCSHGSVHAELVAQKKEEEQKSERLLLEKEEEKKRDAFFKETIRDVRDVRDVEEIAAPKQISSSSSASQLNGEHPITAA